MIIVINIAHTNFLPNVRPQNARTRISCLSLLFIELDRNDAATTIAAVAVSIVIKWNTWKNGNKINNNEKKYENHANALFTYIAIIIIVTITNIYYYYFYIKIILEYYCYYLV